MAPSDDGPLVGGGLLRAPAGARQRRAYGRIDRHRTGVWLRQLHGVLDNSAGVPRGASRRHGDCLYQFGCAIGWPVGTCCRGLDLSANRQHLYWLRVSRDCVADRYAAGDVRDTTYKIAEAGAGGGCGVNAQTFSIFPVLLKAL